MKRIIDIDEKDYEVIKRECSNKDVVPIGWVQILNGKPLQTEYEEIKAEICKKHKIDCDLKCRECIYYPCLDSGASYIADIKILDKHIKELNNEKCGV